MAQQRAEEEGQGQGHNTDGKGDDKEGGGEEAAVATGRVMEWAALLVDDNKN